MKTPFIKTTLSPALYMILEELEEREIRREEAIARRDTLTDEEEDLFAVCEYHVGEGVFA